MCENSRFSHQNRLKLTLFDSKLLIYLIRKPLVPKTLYKLKILCDLWGKENSVRFFYTPKLSKLFLEIKFNPLVIKDLVKKNEKRRS